jgi:prepilin-type N-terminal cleavage/methylation domain-containing protein
MKYSRGFVLIELLVVVALLAVAAGVYFGWYSPSQHKKLKEAVESGNPQQVPVNPETVLGQAYQKGQSTECMNNLSQIRQALQLYTVDNDRYPSSLEELNLANMVRCPISGQAYQYDPNTGTVRCPTHPKY